MVRSNSERYGPIPRNLTSNVNPLRTLLLENLGKILRLVIDGDIGSPLFQHFALVLVSARAHDNVSSELGQLNSKETRAAHSSRHKYRLWFTVGAHHVCGNVFGEHGIFADLHVGDLFQCQACRQSRKSRGQQSRVRFGIIPDFEHGPHGRFDKLIFAVAAADGGKHDQVVSDLEAFGLGTDIDNDAERFEAGCVRSWFAWVVPSVATIRTRVAWKRTKKPEF